MKNDFIGEERKERQTKIRQTQMDMFSLQSDRGRFVRKQNLLKEEIRKIKIDLAHLKVNLEEKIKTEALLEREIIEIDEKLAHTKKQMNTLK